MARVLAIAAHPDDEVLGCGATLARHAAAGDTVEVLILAEGLTSRGSRDVAALAALHASAQQAAQILGVQRLRLEQLPDNRMDTVALLDVVQRVEAVLAELQPEVVYTHHAGDVNIDHQRTHQAVVTACRALPGSVLRELLFFEVPSSTEWQTPGSAPAFQPQWFVDVTTTLPQKRAALQAYASEMREFPHPRSLAAVEHLAHWRGASAGYAAAEAFMVGRVRR